MNAEQFFSALRQIGEDFASWLARVDFSAIKLTDDDTDEQPIEARVGHQGCGMYQGDTRIDPYDPSDPQDMM